MKVEIVITLAEHDPIMDVLKTLGRHGPPKLDATAEFDGATVEMSNRPERIAAAEAAAARPTEAQPTEAPTHRDAISPPPPPVEALVETPVETPVETLVEDPVETLVEDPPVDLELDAAGEAWDSAIHSPNKTKTQAGLWRKKRQSSRKTALADETPQAENQAQQPALPQGPCNEGQFATAVRAHRDRWGHAETQKALTELAGVDHPAKVKADQFERVRDGLASWAGGAIDLEEFL